ncbi:AAA family ATPase [Roseibium aestuarii]|uniref:CpaE family protein n=1 Tax=Roseibium aestuarii TaxID=2600299 RepID=A0ABW4JYY8_9HYPH|nr:CpaE family protein [Roseibium aestuarii]
MSDPFGSGSYQAYADRPAEVPEGASNIRAVPRISVQCFCLDDRTMRAIESASEDRRMQKAHVKVHQGGLPAAIEHYAQAPTPNLIVLEAGEDRQRLVDELDQLAEYCDAGTKVIVIGQINDVSLYRELMAKGISEYLVAPIDLFQFIAAIGELYGEPGAEPLGRTIAFFGVKGGCGASTIAHNCAWALARNYRNEVTVADLDLPFGTAGLDYNQDPLQGVFEAVSSPERLDETYLDRIMAKCSEHLTLLAAPATLERAYDFSESAFDGLMDVMRAATPTIVLDVPHCWNGWTRQILTHADDIVVVAEPDLANLRNAKNVIDSLRQLRPNDAPPHLVLNRTNMAKRPEIKPEEFATALGLKAQLSIPFDPQLFGTAANNGQMIAEVDAKHPVADMFGELATLVSGRSDVNKVKRTALKGLLSKLTRRSA